jgi:imidazolonepropionase-like amidohydrolase
MKKILIYIFITLSCSTIIRTQETIYPAREFKGLLFITNGIVHTGNGQVLENTTIQIENGKITKLGTDISVPSIQAKIIDAKGKQVYPGLILSSTDLGLKEIANGVRGSNDYVEIGEYNPSVRSIVAYNTDSKITGTLRANGILLANITPEGGIISGSSSVVQLDAWNWEDAVYKYENGIHLTMPTFIVKRTRFSGRGTDPQPDLTKQALDKIEEIKSFFREAKAYLNETNHKNKNLKFESVKDLFSKKQKLFIHADQVKQMFAAIDFIKEFDFNVVIIGASESFQIADILKQNNIAIILNQLHTLPTLDDDDVDQPFKTPAALQKAGVLFALNDAFDEARYRNLAFNAGTSVTYGLTKEEALQSITLSAAKILGIDDKTGSIEVGKDANIIISEGDILDMKSSIIKYAFIQGRQISLENKQTQLYERYKYKYGIE